MILLDQMVKTRRLYEFIDKLVEIKNEELEEKATWEFWLHKDHERTYAECRNALIKYKKPAASEEELVDIILQSQEIASFVPL